MSEHSKTHQELIEENAVLKERILALERQSAEEKRAALVLKESAERYRLVVDNVQEGLILQEASGRILIWNKSAERVFGITTEEALCHIWLSITAIPLFEPGESVPFQVYATFEDVTERRQAIEALEEREAFIKATLDNLPVGVAVNSVDPKVHFTYMNENFAKFYRTTREALAAPNDFWEVVYTDATFREEIKKRVLEDCASNDPKRMHWEDVPVSRPGKKPFYITAKNIPLPERNLMVSTVWDVTERKQAEEALNRRNIYLEALNETTLGLMQRIEPTDLFQIIVDRAAQLARADEGWICIIDPEKDDVEFKAIVGPHTFLKGSRFESSRGIIGEVLRTDRTVLIDDYHVWPKRAGLKCYDVRRATIGMPLRYENRLAGILCLSYHDPSRRFDDDIIDILERLAQLASVALDNIRLYERIKLNLVELKEAEDQQRKLQTHLNQAQKMESVGRLAGGVAHDFNNMLGIILGHTEMALSDMTRKDPLYSDLTEIAKAARRSTDLTRQLLGFARRQTIAPKVINLNETVEKMLKMLRRVIGEDIDLAWMPGKKLWTVTMDPSQLDQILANLCVNARDAIEGVGKVTIETEKVTLDENYCADRPGFHPGDYVMLAVSDDGIGMEREILTNIFDPFFTTKEVGKGTGLGLATVYGIVKQNDGYINVYSEPGEGTTFKIYIPRHTEEPVGAAEKSLPATPTGGDETVLLVEDEPMLLEMGKAMLERFGYRVIAAGSPAAAIKIAEENKNDIHLLITDVIMPGMTGRELADRLSSLYPDMKLIFMSGYTADAISRHGVLDPGVKFVQKPFSMRDLVNRIREALEG